jgi:hypothetical protein
MGTILFSQKVITGRGDHLVNEPDAVGAVKYRADVVFGPLPVYGTIANLTRDIEIAFDRYATIRREKAELRGSMLGHTLLPLDLGCGYIEWIEYEYAT